MPGAVGRHRPGAYSACLTTRGRSWTRVQPQPRLGSPGTPRTLTPAGGRHGADLPPGGPRQASPQSLDPSDWRRGQIYTSNAGGAGGGFWSRPSGGAPGSRGPRLDRPAGPGDVGTRRRRQPRQPRLGCGRLPGGAFVQADGTLTPGMFFIRPDGSQEGPGQQLR
jgi:hypothetical protein